LWGDYTRAGESTRLEVSTLAFPIDDMGWGDESERRSLSEHCQAVALRVARDLRLSLTVTPRPCRGTADERSLVNLVFDAACSTPDVGEAAAIVVRRYR
jgi:hypothetical protein